MRRALLAISVAVALLAALWTTLAVAQTNGFRISLRQAKKELRTLAYFTCPTTECSYRVRDCRQPSPLRVECRSEFLEPFVKTTEPGKKRDVLFKEFCAWTGVATPPSGGSTTRLKVAAEHLRCRKLGPNMGWPSRVSS